MAQRNRTKLSSNGCSNTIFYSKFASFYKFAAEGVGVSVSEFAKEELTVYEVEYCAYSQLQRSISLAKDNTYTTGTLQVLLAKVVETGISYYPVSSTNEDVPSESC